MKSNFKGGKVSRVNSNCQDNEDILNLKCIAFCTIITRDYLHYALTLLSSLVEYEPSAQLHVLVVDKKIDSSEINTVYPQLKLYTYNEVCDKDNGLLIFQKYRKKDLDCLRWSLKPVFLIHLLNAGYNQAFFLDPDIHFFASPYFLVHEMKNNSILLTPHWRCSDPSKDSANFAILQTSGLFNAGFVGATRSGISALNWWASVCLNECVKDPERGLFNDQAYLDLLPVYFENVKILRHKGCNVANWNQVECHRTMSSDGFVTLDGYPLIFIHFTASTIWGIESEEDVLLRDYLKIYKTALTANKQRVVSLGLCWGNVSRSPKKVAKQLFYDFFKMVCRCFRPCRH